MTPALVVALALSAAPLADVWPYAVKRSPDGTVAYSYDLSGVKAAGGTPDAKAAHGDEKVAEFLKGLPKETKVSLREGASLTVTTGRGLEHAPLSNAFASVPDGALASDDPLGRAQGARLRPPFHIEEGRVLPSVDAVLWRVRELEDGALAAVALDNEALHQQLWSAVTKFALARLKNTTGDSRDGAHALAARLLASEACLDLAKVPSAAMADQALATAVEAELTALKADPDVVVPVGLDGWNKELRCASIRLRALAQPFPDTRVGIAAALTLAAALEDPKLGSQRETLRRRRDAFFSGPLDEPFAAWKARLPGKAQDSLDDLAGSIDKLRNPPSPFARAATPFQRFLYELEGPARVSAVDELVAAAQDGRIKFPTGAEAPASALRESALMPPGQP